MNALKMKWRYVLDVMYFQQDVWETPQTVRDEAGVEANSLRCYCTECSERL